MIISAIAAMSTDRVIGRENQLPWNVPADLKRFRALTRHKPVIMGRKTFESIGRPLPDRPNLIITRQKGWSAAGTEVFATIHDAIARAHQLAPGKLDEIFIVGGGEIYRETMPLWDRIYLTVIETEVGNGDTHFPEFGSEFKLAESIPGEDGGFQFRYENWIRS